MDNLNVLESADLGAKPVRTIELAGVHYPVYILADAEGNPYESLIDPVSGKLVVISEPHALIHAGKMFHMTQKITGIIDGATIEFLMRIPAGIYPHIHKMRTNVGSGDIDIVAYETPTVSDPGTIVPTHNVNRNSSNTPGMTFYGGPTFSAAGLEIHRIWIPPSATGQGGSAQGVSNADAGEEWILKPDTDYIQQFTNNSGDTISAWIEMLWYEL